MIAYLPQILLTVESRTVFEFGNKRVKEHLGDIHSFLQKKKLENLRELERIFFFHR